MNCAWFVSARPIEGSRLFQMKWRTYACFVVKWTMFCVAGHPLEEGVAAFAEAWGRRPDPPAISAVIVAGLANPAFLVEIEAVAVLPGG